MSDAARVLNRALLEVKTFDPHCHLRVHKPTADNLADLLQYHHVWIELVSSGMGQQELSCSGLPQELAEPQISPQERVRRCLKHLPAISSTTQGVLLRWLLQDLYGLESITGSSLEKALALVESRGRDPGWTEEVLGERCGIECSISVEHAGTPIGARLLKARELYVTNIVNGKQPPAEVLAGWEEMFQREIESARDYVDFLQATVASLPAGEYKFIGLWVLPNLAGDVPPEREVTEILRKVRGGGALSPAEVGSFCSFGLQHLLQFLARTPIRVIQVIVGAEVLPPHRSITQWDGAFCGAAARIAGRFEGFHFSLSSAADAFTQDLGILAKHVPNISVCGYWWHTLYPFYLRKSIETRLDMVPLNKIIAFFSDAYHAEWCYPKLKLVKQAVHGILTERVERGWYSLETARRVIRHIFYENPKRIYGLP